MSRLRGQRFCWTAVAVAAVAAQSCARPLDERMADYLEPRLPSDFSGAIVLIEDGRTAFASGYGLANRERGVAFTPETVVPFGSIVKDFTRFVVLDLVEEGRIDLDAPLSRFFEDVPADKASISIRHLLMHTSGLATYHGDRRAEIPADHVEMTEDEARSLIFAQTLAFEPGEGDSYSNSGYTLLAMIVERTEERRFTETVRARLLEPAGMTRSSFYRDPRWSALEVAVGYGPVRYGEENSPLFWPVNAWPIAGNGGMAGPLLDLYRAFRFIDARRSASPGLDANWRATGPEQGPRDVYGSAGGNDFGFVTVFFLDPADGDALMISTNADDDGREDADLVLGILDEAFGFAPSGGAAEGGRVAGAADEADIPSAQRAWGLPDRGTWRRVSAVIDGIATGDEDDVRGLVKGAFSPRFRGSVALERHVEEFARMHALLPDPEVIHAERANGVEFLLTLRDTRSSRTYQLSIRLTGTAPFSIDEISLADLEG